MIPFVPMIPGKRLFLTGEPAEHVLLVGTDGETTSYLDRGTGELVTVESKLIRADTKWLAHYIEQFT
jgi:predicted AAA+ superfamily ATPase